MSPWRCHVVPVLQSFTLGLWSLLHGSRVRVHPILPRPATTFNPRRIGPGLNVVMAGGRGKGHVTHKFGRRPAYQASCSVRIKCVHAGGAEMTPPRDQAVGAHTVCFHLFVEATQPRKEAVHVLAMSMQMAPTATLTLKKVQTRAVLARETRRQLLPARPTPR